MKYEPTPTEIAGRAAMLLAEIGAWCIIFGCIFFGFWVGTP